ncbi:MAG TPA: sodium/proline symporter PutP, partial [Stackebrandtia sp.]|uniref:sodium/proline symporter PutP n=1 Tax=Stackebrandtia sp. TaxID=2023065 RepID=UPI002D4A66E6
MAITFIVYLLALIVLGIWMTPQNRGLKDFALGGRSLTPPTAGVSAGAADMSGWVFLGLPGAVYASGLSATWIVIGLALGTYGNWRLIAPRLRVYTERAGDSVTLPSYFEERFADPTHMLRLISAAVTLVFFTVYVSSGLIAGGLLFQGVFGLNPAVSAGVAVLVIGVYTAFGGFKAVSRAHLLHGSVMVIVLGIVGASAFLVVGGPSRLSSGLYGTSPALLNMVEGASFSHGRWHAAAPLGVIAVLSGLAWGLGYPGQPHILARFMAIRGTSDIKQARRVGMAWVLVVLAGATMIGLSGIVLLDHPVDNPETVYIAIANFLGNPWVAAILLTAVLAAIMSTADSQLLVSANTLAEDFYHAFLHRRASDRARLISGRVTVVLVAAIAYVLALSGGSVLDIVSYAWAGFGASFGPVILLSLFWPRMTWVGALAGIVAGSAVVLLWSHINPLLGPLRSDIYEMIPAWIVATAAILVFGRIGRLPQQEWRGPTGEPPFELEQVDLPRHAPARSAFYDPQPMPAPIANPAPAPSPEPRTAPQPSPLPRRPQTPPRQQTPWQSPPPQPSPPGQWPSPPQPR